MTIEDFREAIQTRPSKGLAKLIRELPAEHRKKAGLLFAGMTLPNKPQSTPTKARRLIWAHDRPKIALYQTDSGQELVTPFGIVTGENINVRNLKH